MAKEVLKELEDACKEYADACTHVADDTARKKAFAKLLAALERLRKGKSEP